MKSRKHLLLIAWVLMVWAGLFSVSHAAPTMKVTSISGPARVYLGEEFTLTYEVENTGEALSEPYVVELYLSLNKTIDTIDHRLKKVSFPDGLAPGETLRAKAEVTVNNYFEQGSNTTEGKYYFGAIVRTMAKSSGRGIVAAASSPTDPVYIERFRVNEDDTVSDLKEKLMWTRPSGPHTWASARDDCKKLDFAGHKDWWLPTIETLSTLINRKFPGNCEPGLDCYPAFCWSSSTVQPRKGPPEQAWGVDFSDGSVLDWNMNRVGVARCVRGEP